MLTYQVNSLSDLLSHLQSGNYSGEPIIATFGEEMTDETIDNLIAFLLKNKFPCLIQLKNASPDLDLKLKNIFLRNQRLFNIQQLREKNILPTLVTPIVVDDKNSNTPPINLEKISRAKLNLAKGEIGNMGDLQQQRQQQHKQSHQQQQRQQQQQQQATQTALDKRHDQLSKRKPCPPNRIKKDVDESTLGELVNEANIEQVFGAKNATDKIKLKTIWKELVGEHADEISSKYLDRAITHVQKNAMEKIIAHYGEFRYGLVFDNLPDGFQLQQTKDKLVLCYDENLSPDLNHPNRLFKINLPKPNIYQGNVEQLLLDIEEEQQREEIKDKFKFIELLYKPNASDADIATSKTNFIDLLCLEHPEWKNNIEKLIHQLELDSLESLKGLWQAYLSTDSETVILFLNKLEAFKSEQPKQYKLFKETFLENSEYYSDYVTVDGFKNLDSLKKLSFAQRSWWESLTQQHKKSAAFANFNDLFNAFAHFSSELIKLTGAKDLPSECSFPDVKNMKVALDRLLFIIGRAVDKDEQIDFLKGLDLSAEGAYYASCYENFKLVVQVMRLIANQMIDTIAMAMSKKEILEIDPLGDEEAMEHNTGYRLIWYKSSTLPTHEFIHGNVSEYGNPIACESSDGVTVDRYFETLNEELNNIDILNTEMVSSNALSAGNAIDNIPLTPKQHAAFKKAFRNNFSSVNFTEMYSFSMDDVHIVVHRPLYNAQKPAVLANDHPFNYAVPKDHGQFLKTMINEKDFTTNKKYFFRHIGEEDMTVAFDIYRYILSAIEREQFAGKNESSAAISNDAFIQLRGKIEQDYLDGQKSSLASAKLHTPIKGIREFHLLPNDSGSKASKYIMGEYYPDNMKSQTIEHFNIKIDEDLFSINRNDPKLSHALHDLEWSFATGTPEYRKKYIDRLQQILTAYNRRTTPPKNEFEKNAHENFIKFFNLMCRWYSELKDYHAANKEVDHLKSSILHLVGLCSATTRQLEKGLERHVIDDFMQMISNDLVALGNKKVNAVVYSEFLQSLYEKISKLPTASYPSLNDLQNILALWIGMGPLNARNDRLIELTLSLAQQLGSDIYNILDVWQKRKATENISAFNCEQLFKKIDAIMAFDKTIPPHFYQLLGFIADIDKLDTSSLIELANNFISLPPPSAQAFIKTLQGIQIQESDGLPTANDIKMILEEIKTTTFTYKKPLHEEMGELLQSKWPDVHVIEHKQMPDVLLHLIDVVKDTLKIYNAQSIAAFLLPLIKNQLTSQSAIAAVDEASVKFNEFIQLINEKKIDSIASDVILAKLDEIDASFSKLLANEKIHHIISDYYKQIYNLDTIDNKHYINTKQLIDLIKAPLQNYMLERIKSSLNGLRIKNNTLIDYLEKQLTPLDKIPLPNQKLSAGQAIKVYTKKADTIFDFINTLTLIYNRNPRSCKALHKLMLDNTAVFDFKDYSGFEYHAKFIKLFSKYETLLTDKVMSIIYSVAGTTPFTKERLDHALEELNKLLPYAKDIPPDAFNYLLELSFKHNLQHAIDFPIDALIDFKKLNLPLSDTVFNQITSMMAKTPEDAEKSAIAALELTKQFNTKTALPLVKTLLEFYKNATKQNWDAYHACLNKLVGRQDKLDSLVMIISGIISSKIEPLDEKGLLEFIDQLLTYDDNTLETIGELFIHRPSPSYKQMDDIHQAINDKKLAEWITAFDLDPFGVRDNKNKEISNEIINDQFDVSQVQRVVQNIQRLPDNEYLTEFEQTRLKRQLSYLNIIGKTRGLRVDGKCKPLIECSRKELKQLADQLIAIIQNPKDAEEKEKAQLSFLAIAREVFFRTSGKFPHSTQMIAALMSLNYPDNLLLQLNTGEGKSILSPLILITEWIKGGSVNFCTSNPDLAERDKDESAWFYAFFNSETQLLTKETPSKSEAIRTIHYSDMPGASLYRSNAKLFGHPIKVKKDKATGLVIDESDDDFLDKRTYFNLANSGEHNPYEWIYPIINEFVDRDDYLNVNSDVGPVWDEDRDLREFKAFLADQILSPKQKSQLKNIFEDQWKKWLYSATTAKQHRLGSEYFIHTERRKVKGEMRDVSIAVPFDKNIQQWGSSREYGIQQFLHARLQKTLTEQNPGTHYYFPIDDESIKTASETVKTFADRHTKKGGRLVGISATLGSMVELAEQKSKYRVQAFNIPPHLPSQRKVGAMQVTANAQKQIEAIFAELQQLRKAGKKPFTLQPTLIVCKNMEEAKKMHEALVKKLENNFPDIKMNPVFGDETSAERKKRVDKAGEDNTITISTSSLGRGTDIKIKRHQPYLLKDSESLDDISLNNNNLKENTVYIKFGNKELHYVVLDPTGKRVTGRITEAEMKKVSNTPFQPDRLFGRYSLMRGISTIIAKRGHTKPFRGLAVIQTYLDTDRLMKQILGRTARNGELGYYTTILGESMFYGINLLTCTTKQREEKLKQIHQRMDEDAAVTRYYVQEMDSIQNIILDNFHKWHKLVRHISNDNPDIEKALLTQRQNIIDNLRDTWNILLEASDPQKQYYANFYVRRTNNGPLETEALDNCIVELEKESQKLYNRITKEINTKFIEHAHLSEKDKEIQQTLLNSSIELALNARKLKTPAENAALAPLVEQSSQTKNMLFQSAFDPDYALARYGMDLDDDEKNASLDKASHYQLNVYAKWLPDIIALTRMNHAEKTYLLNALKNLTKTPPASCAENIDAATKWINDYYHRASTQVDQFYIQPFAKTVLDLAKQIGKDNEKNINFIREHYIDNAYADIKNQLNAALNWRKEGKWYHQIERQVAKETADAILACINTADENQDKSAHIKELYKTLLLQKQILQNKFIIGILHDNVKKTVNRALLSLDSIAETKSDWAQLREEAELELLMHNHSALDLNRLTTLKNHQWKRHVNDMKLPCKQLQAYVMHTGFKEFTQVTIELDKANSPNGFWEACGFEKVSPTAYIKRFNNTKQLLEFDEFFINKSPKLLSEGKLLPMQP